MKTRLCAMALGLSPTLAAAGDFTDELGHGAVAGNRVFAISGYYQTGDRLAQDGAGVVGRLELMSLGMPTSLGTRAGFELTVDVGYEQFDEIKGDSTLTQGPMAFDVSVGFPVELFGVGVGVGGLSLIVGPGFGIGVQQAYGYVRGRLALDMGKGMGAALTYSWNPSEASYAWEDHVGLNLASLQASAHVDGFFGYAELVQANVESYSLGDPGDGDLYRDEDPLLPVNRAEFQRLWRVGGGVAW